MTGDKKEQIKTYVVIGLAVVAATVAYFRFVHKKAPRSAKPAPTAVATAPLDVSKIDIKLPENTKSEKSLFDESLRPFVRDIFAPLKWPEPKEEIKPPEPEPPKPPPVLKLRGTIVEGEKAIAIINDQFVRPGDWIDEYRVVRISKDKVFLSSVSRQMVLDMYGE